MATDKINYKELAKIENKEIKSIILSGKDTKKEELLNNICKYLYIKDRLTEEEKIVLRAYYFASEEDFKRINEFNEIDIQKLLSNILIKIDEILLLEKELLSDFFNNLIAKFGEDIFGIDLDIDVSEYKKSLRFTYYRWKDKTLKDLYEILRTIDIEVPKELEDKLKMFFNAKKNDIHPSTLEIVINRIVLALDKIDRVSNDKLYKVFKNNINSFDEIHRDALRVYFGEMSRKDFNKLYPINNYHKYIEYGLDKLNFLYFNLRSYRNYNFNREKYLGIRDKCYEVMQKSGYYLRILDCFFGYKTGKQITQRELADKFGLPLLEMKEKLRTAKLQAGNVLADISCTMTLDMKIYKDYLLNNNIEFKEPTKTIVWEYIVNGNTYAEIAQKVGYNTLQVSNTITDALWKIDKYRFGLNVDLKRCSIKDGYNFIDLDYLKNILSDSHIPLAEVDKYMLKAIFGIDMAPKEDIILAQELGITKRSLIRKMQRALILLKRYQNKEISGVISYQDDVEPNLKYFTKPDQEVLKMYYKDKLLVKEIASRCNLRLPQGVGLTNKLRIYLKDILNGAQGFDFDYFYEHIDDNEVPLYGNKELALYIFKLYYENRMGANELEKKLKIDANTIRRILMTVSIAFCKRKDGIKKIRDFTLEEVKDYFNKNKDTMSNTNCEFYINFITKMENPFYISTKCPMPFQILYDLSRNNPNFIRLADFDKKRLKDIVLKNKNRLKEKYIVAFARYLGVSSREFMNGKDKNQVISFLMKVEEELELKKKSCAIRTLEKNN